MTSYFRSLAAWGAVLAMSASLSLADEPRPPEMTADLKITGAKARVLEELDLIVFEQTVDGSAGGTVPAARGAVHGAPVLGYVFPTTLAAMDVGFGNASGIVALAVTAHPDFEDTPLWDENGNQNYSDDGVVFHSHWVLLVEDPRTGSLAVKETTGDSVLPPTNPGMAIYLDSPGFSVVLRGNTIRVLVPINRVGGRTDFRFDAVSAYLEVNQSDASRPTLGVYRVYSVLSTDLSLPFAVELEEGDGPNP